MDETTLIQVKTQSKHLLLELEKQERVLKDQDEANLEITEEDLDNVNVKKRILLSNTKRSQSFLKWMFNNKEL